MLRVNLFGTMLLVCTLGLSAHATAGELPRGYSCNDLRSTVASYGASLVLTAARSRGLSERQIVSIRQRCRV